jgi:uncharacterized damage-inducible protein DinB
MMLNKTINSMIEDNLVQLDMLESMLGNLDPKWYALPLAMLNGAWIGKHVRHILDIYLCLQVAESEGEVCYEHRTRNEVLEQDPMEALRTIGHIREFLEQLMNDRPLGLRTWHQDRMVRLESSLARELLYACEHGIHHFALLRVALNESGMLPTLPEAFGVAPSTLRYLTGKQPS